MKNQIYCLILFTFFALLTFTACQNETTDINEPENQETILPSSQLARFMGNVSANDGAYDNFLDNSSCFSIALPVTIIIDDITIVIENLEDLNEIEALFEAFDDEDDFFDFLFPITIIFNDYTEVVIENFDQLETWIEECDFDENDEDEIIECVDFVFPISFSVFNSDFNIVDTVIIENDEALYQFLEDLEDEENVLIVSLNYPVTLVYANGETIEVNSNEELADAIEAAESDCSEDEDDNCDLNTEELENYLLECGFEAEFSINDDQIDALQFQFNQSGEVVVTGDAAVVDSGTWEVLETDLGIKLIIDGLQTFTIANGLWLLEACDEDGELEFLQETDNGNITMELELDCNDDEEVFDCFGDFELEECLGPNNEAEFNLSADTIGLIDCQYEFIPSFHVTEQDALANTNAIPDTESYWSSDGQVFLRIESLTGNFEIFTIYLNTEECDYFECFGNYNLTACDENDNVDDGFAEFDLDLIFANCPNDDVVYYFYISVADAEAQVAPLASPFSSSLATTIYSRVELAGDPSIYQIFEHQLIVEDCYEDCSEEDVDAFLVECIWNAVNYNGSDNLMNWNFDFEPNSQTVVIYTDSDTIDAVWTTSQSNDGVILTFSNVAGPNIQAITGEWLIVECEEDRLELQRGNDILVLERTCN